MKLIESYICLKTSELLKFALSGRKEEFFLYYLDVSSQKVEEFKHKYSENENAWQVLHILNEKHHEVVEQYQSQYFDIEMSQLKHFTENSIKLKCKQLEQKVQDYDETAMAKLAT